MNLVSISQQEIEDRLIDYFANHFNDKPSDLTPATNIPKTYNLGASQWAAFADTLSKLAWMRKLRVRLAQKEMVTVPQIQQLAAHIVRKMQLVVAIPPFTSEIVSLESFLAIRSKKAVTKPKQKPKTKSSSATKKKVKKTKKSDDA